MTKIKLDYHAMRTSAQSLRNAEAALRTARASMDLPDLEQGAPPALVASIRETVTSVRNRVDHVADSTDRMHRLLHKRADRAEFLDGGSFGGPGLWLPRIMFKGQDKGVTRFNGEEPGTEWRKGKDGRWTKHRIPPERMGIKGKGPDAKEKPWKPGFLGFDTRPGKPGRPDYFLPGKAKISLTPVSTTPPLGTVNEGVAAAAAIAIGGRRPGPPRVFLDGPDRGTGRPVATWVSERALNPGKIVKGVPLPGVLDAVRDGGGFIPRTAASGMAPLRAPLF